MFSVDTGSQLGTAEARVTSGRGLNARELTEMALAKILFIGPDVPPAIRDQATAFKARIEAVLLHYITQAQRSQNTTIYNVLMQAGQHDAAELVRKL